MRRNAPRSIPPAIAVNRSVAMVRRAVASHAHASLLESFTRRGISLQWLIVRTFDMRMAEITGSGMNGTKGVARKNNDRRNTLCSIPAAGDWPPPRTLVDV